MTKTQTETQTQTLYIGIDIGSTTTKLVLMDPKSEEILYSDYRRHGARQIESVKLYLEELRERLSDKDIHIAMTGSGAKDLSDALGLSYVQ